MSTNGDPLHDDRFPSRPTHPDFWRMADVVLQHDGMSTEDGKSVVAICELLGIDVESLSYMAHERIGHYVKLIGTPTTLHQLHMMIMGAWIDAFAAGVAYERKENPPTT